MKRRIWTCLEWVLINKPDIMRDRHLDQVIMCVLYVVCKVSPPSLEEQAPTLAQVTGKGHERTFTDIMKHYRSQPQATSHIYRSVLLAGGREAAASPPTPSPHPPPTPGRMAASSTVAEDGEERGDLIKFYNAVFLPLVQDYAMRFKKSSSGSTGSMPPLSPLPQLRANPSSPRRKVSEAHSVFTRPLRPSKNGATEAQDQVAMDITMDSSYEEVYIPPHSTKHIIDGALVITCQDVPMTVQARLCPQEKFEKIHSELTSKKQVRMNIKRPI